MHSYKIFAASVCLAMTAAVPMQQQHEHHRRELIWVTSTDEVVVTVPVTATIWVDPQESMPTESAHQFPHFSSAAEPTHAAPSPSASMAAPANSKSVESASPATSSSGSIYVAPASELTTSSAVSATPAPEPTTSSSASAAPAPEPTTSSSVFVTTAPSSAPIVETPAPAPSSSSDVVSTAPSSTYVAPTSQTASTATVSSSASASSGSAGVVKFASFPGDHTIQTISNGLAKPGTSYSGDLTYYTPGLGACGWTNGEDDRIVAIAASLYNSYSDNGNPNNNPVCGQIITITGTDGSSYKAIVTDRCVGCEQGSLDMPQSFFNTVTAGKGDGRVHGIKWSWD